MDAQLSTGLVPEYFSELLPGALEDASSWEGDWEWENGDSLV